MSTSKHAYVENRGSAARDWCMLERNALSHVKLALLLSLLSASILLHARLSPSFDQTTSRDLQRPLSSAGLFMACALILSALVALAAGSWEYWSLDRDMRTGRAFIMANKPHIAMLTVVSGVVFTTCIVLLADGDIA